MNADPLTLFTYHVVDNNTPKTLFLFHGTGGNETDLLSLVEPYQKTHTIVGLKGNDNEHGMARFFRRISEGVFDEKSIQEEVIKLKHFLEGWYKKYNTSAKDSIFIGYSNGANFILAALLLYPELIQNAALHHCMMPFTPKKPLKLETKKILITLGKNDPIISSYQSEVVVDTLKKYGAQVTVVETNAGHSFTHEELTALHTFISKNQ